MTLATEGLKLPERLHTLRRTEPVPVADGITVSVEPDFDDDDDDGELQYNEDGSVTVLGAKPKDEAKASKKFDANLAIGMDEMELDTIASELLELIAIDITSRKDWEETFNRGIDLLGLKIESPTSDVTGGGNISKVKDTLLIEACLRYQSNFNAEMLPADGPVKVRDDKVQVPAQPDQQPGAAPDPMMGHNGGPPMGGVDDLLFGISRTDLADAFQRDMNHYLTVVDKPYYADTDRMSFSQALGGCAFKKIYFDPIEQRPVSRFVMANHLIVNNGASSLHDAKRVTHLIPNMSRIVMKQMMNAGAYREVDLTQPTSTPGVVDTKIAETQGTQPRVDRPEDVDYEVYECYCYRDLKGYESKDGLELPYRITIEKDSRKVLEIRRNWKKKDKDCRPRTRFVKYALFPGLGFYDYGFVHILGNTTRVLSAISSLLVDAGMFSNFPGGLIDKSATRQETNQIRPSPGGFKPIDTGGRPIQQVVMPMPYKPPDPTLMALATALKEMAQKLASISELPLGEGRADVPVGTVIALIEQNTKLLSAVHKRNHNSQKEEFELLRELFVEDPEALTRGVKNPARKWEIADEFEDLNLVPASDPNVASHMLRVAHAQAVVQMAQSAPSGLFDPKAVAMRALKIMNIEDPDELFLPPPQPGSQPPSPQAIDAQAKAAQIASKEKTDQLNAQTKLQIQNIQSQDKAADRAAMLQESHERLEAQAMKDAQEFSQGVTPPGAP